MFFHTSTDPPPRNKKQGADQGRSVYALSTICVFTKAGAKQKRIYLYMRKTALSGSQRHCKYSAMPETKISAYIL